MANWKSLKMISRFKNKGGLLAKLKANQLKNNKQIHPEPEPVPKLGEVGKKSSTFNFMKDKGSNLVSGGIEDMANVKYLF